MGLLSFLNPYRDELTAVRRANALNDQRRAARESRDAKLRIAEVAVKQAVAAPDDPPIIDGKEPNGIYAGEKGYSVVHMPPGRHQDTSGLEWGLRRNIGEQGFIVAWFETEEMADEFRAWLVSIGGRLNWMGNLGRALRKTTEE